MKILKFSSSRFFAVAVLTCCILQVHAYDLAEDHKEVVNIGLCLERFANLSFKADEAHKMCSYDLDRKSCIKEQMNVSQHSFHFANNICRITFNSPEYVFPVYCILLAAVALLFVCWLCSKEALKTKTTRTQTARSQTPKTTGTEKPSAVEVPWLGPTVVVKLNGSEIPTVVKIPATEKLAAKSPATEKSQAELPCLVPTVVKSPATEKPAAKLPCDSVATQV